MNMFLLHCASRAGGRGSVPGSPAPRRPPPSSTTTMPQQLNNGLQYTQSTPQHLNNGLQYNTGLQQHNTGQYNVGPQLNNSQYNLQLNTPRNNSTGSNNTNNNNNNNNNGSCNSTNTPHGTPSRQRKRYFWPTRESSSSCESVQTSFSSHFSYFMFFEG